MLAETLDKELLELRERFMDSGRSRRSCTIEKKDDLKGKNEIKNKNAKKVSKLLATFYKILTVRFRKVQSKQRSQLPKTLAKRKY